MKKLLLLLVTVLAVLSTLTAAPVDPPQTPKPTVPVIVSAVYRDDPGKEPSAGIGDIIVVHATGLKDLFARAYPKTGPKQEIRLFINNRQVSDIVHMTAPPQEQEGDVRFKLERTLNNDKIWNDLLGRPAIGEYFFDRPVTISIGLEGDSPAPTTAKFSLIRIDFYGFLAALAVLIVYFWALFKFGKSTCMLRDTPVYLSPLGLGALKPQTPPYSLGKVQMAFWFSVILASYFFIWLITGNYELITPGCLILIGIGAGTALGAVGIDNNKGQATITQIKAIQLQQSQINATITTLQNAVPADPTAPGLIQYNTTLNAQLTANIAQLLAGLTVPNDNFINDILTDANGISFHRLQMFVWTLVLGIVFIFTVWAELAMPNFSATLLTVQGITAGTYLGFKFPEKQS